MRVSSVVLLLVLAVASAGCNDFVAQRKVAYVPAVVTEQADARESPGSGQVRIDRKVIRTAEVQIEISRPEEAGRKLETLAQDLGGSVSSSEVSRMEVKGGAVRIRVKVVVRIPAARFDSALEQIRGIGGTVEDERISSEDVTEEYVDLEARLRAKRATEEQFLQILKQARNVTEVLEVQKALGEVRAELESMEGRRRFLDSQVAMSTITVRFSEPAPWSAGTGGFLPSLREALGDGFDGAVEVVLGLVRVGLIMIPVLLLVVLPLGYLWRRYRRRHPKAPRAAPQQAPS